MFGEHLNPINIKFSAVFKKTKRSLESFQPEEQVSNVFFQREMRLTRLRRCGSVAIFL
jgi:hypothetical protein